MDITKKLDLYCKTLLEWNRIHNLSGVSTKEEILENINDSLEALEFTPPFETACDIGSGAGFPGLILAIAKSSSRFLLIEPNNKKASFLRYCLIELGILNAKVEQKRAEEVTGSFDAIFSRAVAKTNKLLEISSHLCKRGGFFFFFKGNSVINELDGLKNYEIFDKNKRKYLLIRNV